MTEIKDRAAAPSGLKLFTETEYRRLRRSLAAAKRRRPDLSEAARALIAPVELLREMAAATPGVLAERWQSLERLRDLCSLARPLEINSTAAQGISAGAGPEEQLPYLPCLIRPEALVVVGIAVTRVGMEVRIPRGSTPWLLALERSQGSQ